MPVPVPVCEVSPHVFMSSMFMSAWNVDRVRLMHPLSVLTLLLSGTRSSLMRRLVPQSLASSSSAISCRWNTATWADRRLTLPLGVRSKSSPWLWFCAAFSLSRSLSFSFSLSLSLASLSFSLGWPDGAFSCQSFFSGWLCSFLPTDGDSSETTWRSSWTLLWVEKLGVNFVTVLITVKSSHKMLSNNSKQKKALSYNNYCLPR